MFPQFSGVSSALVPDFQHYHATEGLAPHLFLDYQNTGYQGAGYLPDHQETLDTGYQDTGYQDTGYLPGFQSVEDYSPPKTVIKFYSDYGTEEQKDKSSGYSGEYSDYEDYLEQQHKYSDSDYLVQQQKTTDYADEPVQQQKYSDYLDYLANSEGRGEELEGEGIEERQDAAPEKQTETAFLIQKTRPQVFLKVEICQ